jgi:hypothetical protein
MNILELIREKLSPTQEACVVVIYSLAVFADEHERDLVYIAAFFAFA